MQSQNANLTIIKEQPESFWGKLISGSNPEKISQRTNEIRTVEERIFYMNMCIKERLSKRELER